MDRSAPGLARLLRVVATLRSPEGCPWDRGQTIASLRPHLLEEVYEFFDAVERGAPDDIAQEFGDLLFVVALMANAVQDEHGTGIESMAGQAADKMIRRHPHVFDQAPVAPDWETQKQRESDVPTSILSGVPKGMPALARADLTGQRAASVGFDWPDVTGVRAKVTEELAEFDEAMENEPERASEELGDLLFSVAQLARKMETSPEWVLHQATQKFIARFQSMEGYAATREQSLQAMDSEGLEALWETAKRETA